MNHFLSLFWVVITILLIYSIQFYVQYSNITHEFYSKAQTETKCLQSLDVNHSPQASNLKLCVHCLNPQTAIKNEYFKSPISYNTTVAYGPKEQYSNNSLKFLAVNIKANNEFLCEQFLQFVNFNKIFEKPIQVATPPPLQLETDIFAQKIMRILHSQTIQMGSISKGMKSQTFQLASDKSIQKQLVFQLVKYGVPESQLPENPIILTAKYLDKNYFIAIMQLVYNYSILGLIFTAVAIYFLEIIRNGFYQNYINLALSIVIHYACLFGHLNVSKNNIYIESACWASFVWISLIKLDNVDIDKFKYSTIPRILQCLLAGGAHYVTLVTENQILEILYFGYFFGGYLIGYKIILRSFYTKMKYSFNSATINSLIFLCIIYSLIIEASLIEIVYGLRFLRQVEIYKYGCLIICPIMYLVLTYTENQQKIENFQEYKQAKGMSVTIEERNAEQLEEFNQQ